MRTTYSRGKKAIEKKQSNKQKSETKRQVLQSKECYGSGTCRERQQSTESKIIGISTI